MRLRLALPTYPILLLLAACASGPPDVPYPAFLSVESLPDMYLASLPGVRAKPLAGATGDLEALCGHAVVLHETAMMGPWAWMPSPFRASSIMASKSKQ